jgi:hypothetical protein
VAGRHHGVGEDQGGRADLLVGVGVAVEAALDHGPQQPGAPAPVHDEHGARDLGGPWEVEQAQLVADVPVGDPLVVAVGAGLVALGAEDDVVGLGSAVGGAGARGVGQAEEQLADLVAQAVGLGGEGLLALAQLAALGHAGLGLLGLALAAEAADVLGDGLDAAADPVALAGQAALVGVEGEDAVDRLGRVRAPAVELGLDGLGLPADPADVEHGARLLTVSDGPIMGYSVAGAWPPSRSRRSRSAMATWWRCRPCRSRPRPAR